MEHEQIDVHEDGSTTVVTLDGQFIGGDETDALRESLHECGTKHAARVIVDFSAVPYVDSSLIGVLLSANASITKRGGVIALVGMNDAVQQVFTLTKMHLVFPLYETVAVAKQTLNVS
jgi:anti-sigma B factor antagonist